MRQYSPPPMRSFKKQKTDFATSVHHDRQQQQQITCALRPLLQQLTLDNPLAAAPLFEKMIAVLQTHTKLMDPESCRLHGMLLLHLGFVMSSTSKNDDNPTTHSTLVFLLLQCLQALYQHLKDASSLFQSLDSDDLQESFGLVLQIVSGYCLHVENDCDDTSTTVLRQRIPMVCWKVLGALIPSTIGTLVEKHRSLEELLANLLWSISASSNHNNEPARNFLKSLLCAPADLDRKVHHLASIASMALADDKGTLRIINLPSTLVTPQSKVFYWNCIMSCANATKSHVTIESDKVLKELLKIVASCGPSNAAMECLCRLAQQSSLSQNSSLLVSALVTTLLENQWKLVMDPRQALSGLLSLIERRDEGIQAVLQIERLEFFLDLCTKAALTDYDKGTSILASRVFTCIASSMVKEQRTEDTTKILFILSRVTALLSSEVDGIVQNAVDLIHQVLKDPKLRRSVIEEYPDLIPELAQVATNAFSSHATRHKVMQAFHQVVHTEDAFLGEFARYPKVLEAIVQAASQRTIASNQTEMRNVALSLVLRLSSNVCNRRILAKQPGLLPSLIRYTRSVPVDAHEDAILLSREDMKNQILVLATAL